MLSNQRNRVNARENTVKTAVGTMNSVGQIQARLMASGPVIAPGSGAGNASRAYFDGDGLPDDAPYWRPSQDPIGSKPLGGG